VVPWQAPAEAAVFPELEAPGHARRGQEQVLGSLGHLLTVGEADKLVHVVEAARAWPLNGVQVIDLVETGDGRVCLPVSYASGKTQRAPRTARLLV
jgi:hypothetical protein